MNRMTNGRMGRGFGIVLALFATLAISRLASAQTPPHLDVIVPGGFPGMPIMTGIERTSNGVSLTWDGPSGYYQLYQKPALNSQMWQKFGGLNLNRTTNIAVLPGNAFFRVAGPQPRYAGSAACLECHANTHKTEAMTKHASAFIDPLFVAQGGQTNASCLPCHTVGYGLPTGFVGKNDKNTDPRLAGVQCESCHGPAGNHAANENDISLRPQVELASQVCGGCHNEASHRPFFEQWQTSGHSVVVEDMNPSSRINSCGRCHSGSARLALIGGQDPSITVSNDANVAITCAVCHDPHQNQTWTNVVTGVVYTNQLRQVLSSTNDFFLTTSDNFTNKYNPNINVCAQCHNHRGASWTSSSRAPHHSPQYNMLLGTVGVLPAGQTGGPAAHGGTRYVFDENGRQFLVTNQCVSCHMQKNEHQSGPADVPKVANHTFAVQSFSSCVDCHGSEANAEGLVTLVDQVFGEWIQDIKLQLDNWAATKAPPALYAKYGTRAWEYTVPGDLSPGGTGPTTSEQAQIPDNIKKARFNLYIVLYDGSFGVHNGPYAWTLLQAAQDWVQAELDK